MNNIYLETYKIDTGFFPGLDENNVGESISVPYPEKIVRDWYAEKNPGQHINECREAEDPCMEWVNNYYIIPDISELYHYAEKHGCMFEKHTSENSRGTLVWFTVDYEEDEEE